MLKSLLEEAQNNYNAYKMKKNMCRTAKSVPKKQYKGKQMVFEATLKEDKFKIEVPIKEAKPKTIKIAVKTHSQPKIKVKTTRNLCNSSDLLTLRQRLYYFKKKRFLNEKNRFNRRADYEHNFLFDIEDEKQLVRESAFKTDYEKEQEKFEKRRNKFYSKLKEKGVKPLITDSFTYLNDFNKEKRLFKNKMTPSLKKALNSTAKAGGFKFESSDFSPAFKQLIIGKIAYLNRSSKKIKVADKKVLNDDVIFIREESTPRQCLETNHRRRRSSVTQSVEGENIELKAIQFIKALNNNFVRVRNMLKKEEISLFLKRMHCEPRFTRERCQTEDCLQENG